MKRCTNPNCESSFLFGNNKTNCPFCHSPLVSVEEAASAQQLITPIDAVFEDIGAEATPAFITRYNGRMECTGRVVEIEHQALFYGKFHKLFNTIVRGEPFQFTHQSVEYTIRVEPITDGIPSEVTDFCLYGNYLGRLQVGDEVRIKAKDCGHRRVVKSIANLTTSSAVKPGFQISAALIRGLLLAVLLMFVVFACGTVQFVTSGAASVLLVSLLTAVMPIGICMIVLWLLFRSAFPSRRERRRW